MSEPKVGWITEHNCASPCSYYRRCGAWHSFHTNEDEAIRAARKVAQRERVEMLVSREVETINADGDPERHYTGEVSVFLPAKE